MMYEIMKRRTSPPLAIVYKFFPQHWRTTNAWCLLRSVQYYLAGVVNKKFIKEFVETKSGVIALIFALAAIPLFLAAGAAIDFGRVYLIKSELGEALDKAALAVATSKTASEDELDEIFQNYFQANFPEDLGEVVGLSREQTDSTVILSATALVETAFLKIATIDTIEVFGTTTVNIQTTGLEVALVLDNTGSMQFGGPPARIDSLKIAAEDLIDILFGTQDNPDNLAVALVPFVATVNIGNDDFRRQLIRFPEPQDNLYPPTGDSEWKGCVEARESPNDVDDIFVEGDDIRGEWTPYYWENEPSFRISNFNVNNTVCINTWWNESVGPVLPREDRPGPTGRPEDDFFDFSTHPNGPGSFNTDTVPKATRGPNKACPDPIIPLTNNKATLLTAISEMEPWEGNGTMAHLGAAWGWRVLSPEAPFQEGLPYGRSDNNKAIIILTDGQNLITPSTNFLSACSQGQGSFTAVNARYDSHYTAYGYTSQNRLGFDHSEAAINAELDQRLADVCTNIKARGITIYTITFDLDDESTKTLFEECATDATKYFNSPDGETLQASFQAIGAELSNLRISN